MNREYERYIGYIHAPHPKGGKESGTCFFVNANTAIATAHTFDDTCEPYSLFIHGNEYHFGNSDLRLLDKCAIIELKDTPFENYDSKAVSYNLDFNLNCTTNIIWEAFGYAIENDEETKRYISGQLCSYCPDNYLCVLSQPEPRYPSYCGMSGSPVFIHGLLVGILQREQCIQGIPENLYLSAAEEFRRVIPDDAICKFIYNNKYIPPKDYSKKYSTEGLIKRTVISRSTQQISSLYDLVDNDSGNPCYIVLGEAGLGKTKELQRLAVECPSSLHPLYCSLKCLTADQALDDLEPELRLYIENGVPFCLILDGFDEIRDTSLRDDTFPALLEQLITRIERSNVKRFCIIVGSRTAFYYGKKFDGFEEMSLTYLSKEDVDTVLAQDSVDKDSFYTEIGEKSLYSFIQNPFYLKNIVALYQDDGGQLPSANNLMDSIINRLYEKQNAGRFNKTECRKARALLRSVSACFIMRTPDPIDNEEFYSMIESHVDETSLDLINKTGIVDADDSWNLTFKHNNYFEYLAAEFFNIKYKNDLDGLLSIIAYENRMGIFNNFKNMVTYLLLIRETPDLKDWIVEHCPKAIKTIENGALTGEMMLARLKVLFEDAAQKGYYIPYDEEDDVSNIINNRNSILYLIDVLKSSNDALKLTNAVRLIAQLKNTHSLDDEIRQTLLDFIISGKVNHHHIRDALFAIRDLSLSTQGVIDFIRLNFSGCMDREILRGIDKIILANDISDLFVEDLLRQYADKDLKDYLGYDLYDCLGRFRLSESIVRFFSAVLSDSPREIQVYSSSKTTRVLKDYSQSLTDHYSGKKVPERLLSVIIQLSAFLSKQCHFRNNIFSGFLNATGNDAVAIKDYYHHFKDHPVVFHYLSGDLNCFTDFLITSFEDDLFSRDNTLLLFEYCAKGFDKNSAERARCISLIRDKNDENSAELINYITYHDDYSEKEKKKKVQYAELIFNYRRFADFIKKILEESGLDESGLAALNHYVNQEYSYDSLESLIFNLMYRIRFSDLSITDTLIYYEEHPCEWIVMTAAEFVEDNNDYKSFLNESQLERISEEAKLAFDNEKVFGDYSFMKAALLLVYNLDISLSKETLRKLLSVNTVCFPCEAKLGFPDWLVDRLSHEEIISQVEALIDGGLPVSDLACTCIYYCDKKNYFSDNTIGMATKMLNENYGIAFNYAWRYLLSGNRSDILIYVVINDDTRKKYFISMAESISDYHTQDLDEYVKNLFLEIQSLEKAEITDENLAEYRSKYDYIDNHHSPDSVECFNKDIRQSLIYLFPYMFRNNIDDFINKYLDEMICKKTYYSYEQDTFECAVSKITSVEYLEKMIQILQLIADGSFIEQHDFSFLSRDIDNAIANIGKQYPDETLAILQKSLTHSDIRFRRRVNLLYDSSYRSYYEITDKKFTVQQIERIVYPDNMKTA